MTILMNHRTKGLGHLVLKMQTWGRIGWMETVHKWMVQMGQVDVMIAMLMEMRCEVVPLMVLPKLCKSLGDRPIPPIQHPRKKTPMPVEGTQISSPGV